MKMSEAIRLAGMLHPQHYGGSYGFDIKGNVKSTCAVAGAQIAAGLRVNEHGYIIDKDQATAWMRFFDEWAAKEGYIPCPACRSSRLPVPSIVHLNDQHKWTRNQIADWLERSGIDIEIAASTNQTSETDERDAAKSEAKMEVVGSMD